MKVKRGKSIEITLQLSSMAATTFAQWIGCYTVIYNQKARQSSNDYLTWLDSDRDSEKRPVLNRQAAHLAKTLPFLKGVPSQLRRNAADKWFEAMQAALKGLRKSPKVKPKHKKRNCYVTNELFDVVPLSENRCLVQIKASAKQKTAYIAGIVMPFSARDAGKSLYLSRQGNRFWLSMAYDKNLPVASEDEIKQQLLYANDEELALLLEAYDRGVRQQAVNSQGKVYHMPDTVIAKQKTLEEKKKKAQRDYAKKAAKNDKLLGKKRKRTGRERLLLNEAASYSRQITRIKKNNTHHLSKAMADDSPLVGVFENLSLKNMTKRAKAKQCKETGKWLKNGAAAKTGLNRALQGVNLGQLSTFFGYKLAERGKLLVLVNPAYSSQECSQCTHTEKNNRKTTEQFSCLNCGYTADADVNAAQVLIKRGIKHIRSEAFSKEKTVRKIRVKRNKAHEQASQGEDDLHHLGSAGRAATRLCKPCVSQATAVKTPN